MLVFEYDSGCQVAGSEDPEAMLEKQRAAKAKGIAEVDLVVGRSFEPRRCVRWRGRFLYGTKAEES